MWNGILLRCKTGYRMVTIRSNNPATTTHSFLKSEKGERYKNKSEIELRQITADESWTKHLCVSCKCHCHCIVVLQIRKYAHSCKQACCGNHWRANRDQFYLFLVNACSLGSKNNWKLVSSKRFWGFFNNLQINVLEQKLTNRSDKMSNFAVQKLAWSVFPSPWKWLWSHIAT